MLQVQRGAVSTKHYFYWRKEQIKSVPLYSFEVEYSGIAGVSYLLYLRREIVEVYQTVLLALASNLKCLPKGGSSHEQRGE